MKKEKICPTIKKIRVVLIIKTKKEGYRSIDK